MNFSISQIFTSVFCDFYISFQFRKPLFRQRGETREILWLHLCFGSENPAALYLDSVSTGMVSS